MPQTTEWMHRERRTTKRRSLSGVVVWRVWDMEYRRYCFDGREWKTRQEAEKACIEVTRGKRDAMTNWWRIRTVVVPVNADGSSPSRDRLQKDHDRIHGKPDNVPLERRAPARSSQSDG